MGNTGGQRPLPRMSMKWQHEYVWSGAWIIFEIMDAFFIAAAKAKNIKRRI